MLWDARVRALAVPAVAFVLLFSFLPHKELRFIIYVFPLLNIAAASVCHRIWENRSKSTLWALLSLCIIVHLILNAIGSMFFLCVAGSNYPGGLAIMRLHRLERDPKTPVNVHIDVLTAQTGVSRFTQLNPKWSYSKSENLSYDDPESLLHFTHLLMEAKSKYSPNIKPYLRTHDILDAVDGFSHITLNYNMIPPIKIKTKPTIFIMKRKPIILGVKERFGMISEELKWFGDREDGEEENVNPLEEKVANDEMEIPSTELLSLIKESLGDTEEIDEQTTEDSITEESIHQGAEQIPIINDKFQTTVAETLKPEDKKKKRSDAIEKKIHKVDMRLIEAKLEEIQREINEKRQLEMEKIVKIERKISKKSEEILESSLEVEETRKVERKVPKKPEPMEIIKKSSEIEVTPSKLDNKILKKIGQIPVESSEPFKEDNGLKVAIRKLILTKKEELVAKQDANPQILEDSPKIESKMKQKTVESGAKTFSVVSQDLEEPQTGPQPKKSIKIATVKDSIRNIINQFKEFEKDLASEDPESMRKWSSVESTADSVDSTEGDDKIWVVSLEANFHEVDKLIIETDDPIIINDAKKSLKEIIDQFRILRSELSIEADGKFDEIAVRFMERPISETLMYFSEALRDLMDKRKARVGRSDGGLMKNSGNGERRNGARRNGAKMWQRGEDGNSDL